MTCMPHLTRMSAGNFANGLAALISYFGRSMTKTALLLKAVGDFDESRSWKRRRREPSSYYVKCELSRIAVGSLALIADLSG